MPTGHCMQVVKWLGSELIHPKRTCLEVKEYFSITIHWKYPFKDWYSCWQSSLCRRGDICHYHHLHWKLQGYWERWESMSALCHRENIFHEYHRSSLNLRSWLKVLPYDLQLCFLQLTGVVVAVWIPFCRMCLGLWSCKALGWNCHISPGLLHGWLDFCV